MTKEKKKQWLEAIGKLREHYKKYPLNEFPPPYERVLNEKCPLCRVCGLRCNTCLWPKYEDKACMDNPVYTYSTTQKRLDRLDRWEKKVRREK